MSTNSPQDQARRRRKSPKPPQDDDSLGKDGMPRSPRAQSTSLEGIQIQPRTPRTVAIRDDDGVPGWVPDNDLGSEEVELSLLGNSRLGGTQQREAANGLTLEEEQAYLAQSEKKPMSARDKRAIALLIILCESTKVCSLVQTLTSLQTSYRASQYASRSSYVTISYLWRMPHLLPVRASFR